MKKIILTSILIFQIISLFGQPPKWSGWSTHTCYQGLQMSSINYGYVKNLNKFAWQAKIKSTYAKKVTFNMTWKVGEEVMNLGEVALNPGQEYKHLIRYFNSNDEMIYVEVEKVNFSGDLICFAECDNGRPNQPCDLNSTSNHNISSNIQGNTNSKIQGTPQNSLYDNNLRKAQIDRQLQLNNEKKLAAQYQTPPNNNLNDYNNRKTQIDSKLPLVNENKLGARKQLTYQNNPDDYQARKAILDRQLQIAESNRMHYEQNSTSQNNQDYNTNKANFSVQQQTENGNSIHSKGGNTINPHLGTVESNQHLQAPNHVNTYSDNTGGHVNDGTSTQKPNSLSGLLLQTGLDTYKSTTHASTETVNEVSSLVMNLSKALEEQKELKRQKYEQQMLVYQQQNKVKEEEEVYLNEKWKLANGYADLKSDEGYQKAISIMLSYLQNSNQKLNGGAENEIGLWYWKMKDYKNAMQWYVLASEDGNAYGKRNIGVLYKMGWGVPINKLTALEYFQQACIGGLEDGCRDLKEIRNEIEKETSHGLHKESFSKSLALAESYYHEKNFQQAEKFYLQSYKMDTTTIVVAQKLAEMYNDEKQLNNSDLAIKWYEVATKLIDKKYWQEKDLKLRDAIVVDYTEMWKHYAQTLLKKKLNGQLAIEIYKRIASASGHWTYNTNIGAIYQLGLGGVEPDWKLASEYYNRGSYLNTPNAMYYLGMLYEQGGPNLESNHKESKKWYKMAFKSDSFYCKKNYDKIRLRLYNL